MIAIFLFYDEANGIQSRLAFSQEFRHCNIVTFDGSDWVIVEFDKSGIKTRVVKVPRASTFIRALKSIKTLTAMIVVEIGERKKIMWSPWWVRTCNELDRYVAGIDTGLTFNPRHLYAKLLRYNRKRNYEILSHWRRKDGRRTEPNKPAH